MDSDILPPSLQAAFFKTSDFGTTLAPFGPVRIRKVPPGKLPSYFVLENGTTGSLVGALVGGLVAVGITVGGGAGGIVAVAVGGMVVGVNVGAIVGISVGGT